MEKFNKILLLLIVNLIVFSVGYTIGYRKAKNNINDNIIIQDTTYNHIILDSIKYRLIEKDSIIYNIKEDFINGWEVTVKDNGRGLPQNTVIDLQGNSIPGAVAAWTIPKAGGNFDDSEGRKTAGMNGMGVSLTNIFSSRFHGITSNGTNEITVSCRDNLSKIDWTSNKTKNASGTVVIFSPDFSRFDCNEINDW